MRTRAPASRDGRTRPPSAVLLLMLAGLAWLPACMTVGPDYAPPVADVPDAWHEAVTDGLEQGQAGLHKWWTLLGDPLLEDLIKRAEANNLSLKAAFLRIEEARAQRGVAVGELYPEVAGFATLERGRISENLTRVPPATRTRRFYSTGLDATWEIDLWGRVRRAVESADAGIEASVEAYRDVLVLLFSEVASTYVETRALQARIRAAESNARNQRETLKITDDRFKAGIAPALDVAQAKLNVATSESAIPALEVALHAAINRLATLLAEHPDTLHRELAAEVPVPSPPATVAVGAPADVIRQRPDIRQAERELAAQTARIGVATAELYPRLALNGTFSLDSWSFSKLFGPGSGSWLLSPVLGWNLFNGGRVRSAIAVEDARTRQALVVWQDVVLRAIEDVENALVAYQREKVRKEALARAVEAAQETVRLSKDLYRAGVKDFQNVLDAERSLFARQDELAASEGFVTQNLVNLYRALGGGWNPDPGADATDSKTE